MYDLLKASDGLIGHGNGNLNVKGMIIGLAVNSANVEAVEFRMIVFRPFKGEIIEGTIKKNTAKGLQSTSSGTYTTCNRLILYSHDPIL